jgi:ribokinase
LNGLIDIRVVNAIEAEAMGAPAVESLSSATGAATDLLRFADTTVVTAGPAGVSIATRGGRRVEIPGHVVELVSTHGAGDCFIGSLAARLARGADLEDAARYANAAAAHRISSPVGPTCLRLGYRTNIVSTPALSPTTARSGVRAGRERLGPVQNRGRAGST